MKRKKKERQTEKGREYKHEYIIESDREMEREEDDEHYYYSNVSFFLGRPLSLLP